MPARKSTIIIEIVPQEDGSVDFNLEHDISGSDLQTVAEAYAGSIASLMEGCFEYDEERCSTFMSFMHKSVAERLVLGALESGKIDQIIALVEKKAAGLTH